MKPHPRLSKQVEMFIQVRSVCKLIIILISKAATPFTCQVKTLQADARDSKNFSMIG